MNHGFSSRGGAADPQIAAEESRYFQNKAHSARWHCRIGKIRMLTDKEKMVRKYGPAWEAS